MGLSPLQRRIAEIVAGLPEASEFALAGAGGLTVWGVVDRLTRDLDYFATSPAAIRDLLPALELALERAGITVERQRVTEGFVRLGASLGDETCEIDLAHDARIRPAQETSIGPVLALEELAADKVLALFGRAQPRDFLDVDALLNRFDAERLLDLAAQKDPGFDRGLFVDALASLDRLSGDDLGLPQDPLAALRARFAAWRQALVRDLAAETGRSARRGGPYLSPGAIEPPEPPSPAW